MGFLSVCFGLVILQLAYFRLANKYNIIDKPNERSSHKQITIRGGGIIFPISIIAGVVITKDAFSPFIIGLCIISIISFIDDLITLSNKIRILIHFISVSLLMYQIGFLELSFSTTIIGFVIIIGWINAFNFMDGINGITVLYALSVLASCYFINIQFTFIEPSLMEYTAIGLVIFGFYNVRKIAKSFAGDVGSVSMAFILAFIIVSLLVKSHNWQYILLVSLYGIDTVVTIVQRLLRKENIFKAHRSHLYQYLANEAKQSHIVISVAYAFLQLVFNVILILWIIPQNNDLQSVLFIIIQGILYLLIKFRLMNKFKIKHSD